MKLYDETIKCIMSSLEGAPLKQLDIANANWADAGDHNLILRADMAYELGGGTCSAVSAMGVTANTELVPSDEVYLLGPDLSEIKVDQPYARIALVRVAEDSLGDGNVLYNAIRKIEYVRYHINPEGYMTRISASNGREPVRVSKEAIEKGLGFAQVGKLFLATYHENKNIEAVKLIFITQPDFDYKSLAEQSRHLEEITGTIDHIFKNVTMDCGSCSLQQICDEVEGLRELHFKERKGV
ncbi:carbon monoxide dehydrogenase [Pseudobutyrivibrio xylanivorans]|uniref:CO-methylating acetyl-CoA synthase n=1 Tax=Pseudobutyrivibrio xylanivorans DSM 14809 TaxID=1123012 RepID=A0A1M6AA18_PSEXY|nr:carbon monoxide dehydrogenase [Pseudobutyrivibrio xylanivorans]SHI33312.1 CO dehydrogenase/acetyl-CoA synthase complex beta subunit [Pseudobutyrivibrio xylanivorans DSM 14809]